MTDRVVVDRIDFREALVFPHIIRSVVGALQPTRIFMATFVLLCMVMVGRGYDALRGPTVQPSGLLSASRTAVDQAMASDVARRLARQSLPLERRPPGADAYGGKIDVEEVRSALLAYRGELEGRDRDAVQQALTRLEAYRGKGSFDAFSSAIGIRFNGLVEAVMSMEPRQAAVCLGDLIFTIPAAMWREDWLFCLWYLIIGGMTLGVLGAALSRMAAAHLAGKKAVAPLAALDFVLERTSNHALVPLWPGVSLLVLLPITAILGWMGRVPGLDMVAGALYGLALFFGTIAAIVLIPWMIAMPMAIAASVCEGCDGLEAAQRCGALVYRKPIHALFYAVCGVVAVCLLAFVVDLMVTTALDLTAGFASLTAGQGALSFAGGTKLLAPELATNAPAIGGSISDSTKAISVGLVEFWQGLLQWLAAGTVVGAIFTVATACYLALRRTCDDQPFDDLWEPGSPAGTRVGDSVTTS